MKARKLMVMLGLLVLTIGVIGYAGVLVVFQIQGYVQTTNLPILIEEGTNNGQSDLSDTIQVSITNSTSGYVVELTVHPTLAPTYYFDVINLTDVNDGQNYYIRICVSDTDYLDGTNNFYSAKLYLYNVTADSYVDLTTSSKSIDLTSAGACSDAIQLVDGNEYWFVFMFHGKQPLSSADSFTLNIMYSPDSAELSNTLPS